MQCIFSHGMTISFLFENMLANLLSPGTIRKELTETLDGETYPNPLPKDLKPEIWQNEKLIKGAQ